MTTLFLYIWLSQSVLNVTTLNAVEVNITWDTSITYLKTSNSRFIKISNGKLLTPNQ